MGSRTWSSDSLAEMGRVDWAAGAAWFIMERERTSARLRRMDEARDMLGYQIRRENGEKKKSQPKFRIRYTLVVGLIKV